jgi:protoporphyrinogen/coproporphyrinogen III oxidase
MTTKRIIIIGGGIAGLAAAYYTQKIAGEKGIPVHVTVLERGTYWGGKITTERVDGFVIEGGPDTFLAAKPWGIALCRELGLESRLQSTNPHNRNTYVLHRGRLQRLPDGLTMMIPTQFGPMAKTSLLSWPQKARMGLDFFLPPAPLNGDESLGAFISRRLGRATYENLIEPLMSGIYAGDGDQLSLASTFPYLRELELKYGSLARGALDLRKKMPLSPGSRSGFMTPTTGLAEIIEVLVKRLTDSGVALRLNTSVVQLLKNASGYTVVLNTNESIEADSVISAAPAYMSGTLLSLIDSQLSADLQKIPYASTATVSLAYRQSALSHKLDGYGYVIPRRAGRRALACTWTSTKFPHRAPEGYALLRVFIGRAGQDIPWNETELLELARAELAYTLNLTATPILSRVFMWEDAMPQYNLGHPDLLKRIDLALAQHPGLVLAGNGYRGIGIPDCIHSGETAAGLVVNYLQA